MHKAWLIQVVGGDRWFAYCTVVFWDTSFHPVRRAPEKPFWSGDYCGQYSWQSENAAVQWGTVCTRGIDWCQEEEEEENLEQALKYWRQLMIRRSSKNADRIPSHAGAGINLHYAEAFRALQMMRTTWMSGWWMWLHQAEKGGVGFTLR